MKETGVDMPDLMEDIMRCVGSTTKHSDTLSAYLETDDAGTLARMHSMLHVCFKHAKTVKGRKLDNVVEVFGTSLHAYAKRKKPADALRQLVEGLLACGCSENPVVARASAGLLLRAFEDASLSKLADRAALHRCVEKLLSCSHSGLKKLGLEMARRFVMQHPGSLAEKKEAQAVYCHYFRLMAADAADVRALAVRLLQPGDSLVAEHLQRLVLRLKDEDEAVRAEAMQTVAGHRLPFHKLELRDRLLLLDACAHTSHQALREKFEDYAASLIWLNNENLDSTPEDVLVLRICGFFELVDPHLLRYLPRLHRLLADLLLNQLRRLPLDTLRRVLASICAVLKNSDLVVKLKAVELMILHACIAMSLDDAFRHREELAGLVHKYMPSYEHLVSMAERFFQANRKELVSLYYYFKLLEFRVNFIETDRNLLVSALNNVVERLKAANFSMKLDFNDFSAKFGELVDSRCSFFRHCLSEQSFIAAYYLQENGVPPMLLSSLDIFKVVVRIYRRVLTDHNSTFTTEMIKLVNKEMEKKLDYVKTEMVSLNASISQLQEEKEKVAGNKKRNEKELKAIETDVYDQTEKLMKMKVEYYRPLKKGVHLLDTVLSVVDINKEDVILKDLGKLFTVILEDTSEDNVDDEEYTVLSISALSKYVLLDDKKFKLNYEIIYQYIDIDHAAVEDPGMKQLVLILQAISMRSFFDCMFIYDLKQLLADSQEVSYEMILAKLVSFVFAPEDRLCEIACEGLAKLVLHQRLDDPVANCTYLLLVWHSKNRSVYAIQLLSAFVAMHLRGSLDMMETLEAAWERLVLILVKMKREKMVFNQRKASVAPDCLDVVVKSHLQLLRFDQNEQLKALRTSDSASITANERMFVFLCMAIDDVEDEQLRTHLVAILDKHSTHMDFYLHTPKEILLAVVAICKSTYDRVDQAAGRRLKILIENIDTRIEELSKHQTLEDATDAIIENLRHLHDCAKEHTDALEQSHRAAKDDSNHLFACLKRMNVLVKDNSDLHEVVECSDEDSSDRKTAKLK